MDMWSTGAVIAELFSLFPLFPGSNDIDQIFRVFQVMGSPTPDTWEVLRFSHSLRISLLFKNMSNIYFILF